MRSILVSASTCLVALLVAAGGAAAADRCLAGASLLGDERDLAALRQAIEGECPCASFAGGAGADRGAYRRCARRVRDGAIRAGELRSACRGAATHAYNRATCGTALVACGRYTPGARHDPIGCRVASLMGCDGGRRFEESACAAETHCSDVVAWTAGTCTDVRDVGPFGAGVRVVTYTKQSAANLGQDRALETVIWYPTTPGAGAVSPQYQAVVDAPLDGSGGPYPLVLFSHGSCGYPLQSTFLLPQLATHGFVVVAPPHPGNTLYDFPSCGTPAAQAASFVERPNDIVFVLDQVLGASGDPGSPLFGAIDPDRIAMSGHSFGGLTTYLVQAREPRVKVAMPFAPAALFEPELTVPSLTMVGAIDSAVDNELTRGAFERSAGPRYWVEIGAAGHYAFSDGCFRGPDCNPPTTRTQDEAHDAVRRWVLPFLELHLVGDSRFAPFFAPGSEPPGTRFDRES